MKQPSYATERNARIHAMNCRCATCRRARAQGPGGRAFTQAEIAALGRAGTLFALTACILAFIAVPGRLLVTAAARAIGLSL